MPYQPFTQVEVKQMFQRSEGSRSVSSTLEGGVGHAGERHVSISNDGLAARLQDHKQAGLAVYTAFLTFADQVRAATDVLNLPENDALLENFRIGVPQKGKHRDELELKHSELKGNPVMMRYAIGGTARLFPCTHFTMVIRRDLKRPRQMHIVTFFGTMGRIANFDDDKA